MPTSMDAKGIYKMDKEKNKNLNEQIEYIVGRLIVALGKGDFDSTARMYLLDIYGKGYNAAKKETK